MLTKNYNIIWRRGVIIGVGVLAVSLLSACDTIVENNPTQITTTKAETYNDHYALEADTAAIGAGHITEISRHYWAHGETPVQVMVTYDPHSKANTAMRATQEMARITTALRTKSVKNIEADILPVQDSGEISKTLISYDTVHARPPSECGAEMDMDFADHKRGEDYKLGCTIETQISRQIARPKDLNGQDTMDNPDGRKTANALEPYLTGAPNPALSGETASD
ncbi:MAG: CpaD family pilus assembly lipoprotein [Micavibrio sp.]